MKIQYIYMLMFVVNLKKIVLGILPAKMSLLKNGRELQIRISSLWLGVGSVVASHWLGYDSLSLVVLLLGGGGNPFCFLKSVVVSTARSSLSGGSAGSSSCWPPDSILLIFTL